MAASVLGWRIERPAFTVEPGPGRYFRQRKVGVAVFLVDVTSSHLRLRHSRSTITLSSQRLLPFPFLEPL